MRIGIDGRLWSQTGAGRYIRNLVRELAKIDKKNEYILFVKPEDVKNVKFEIRNSKFEIVKTNIRWHSLQEQFELPKVLNKYNLSLVHFPYFSVPIFYNRPFVVTIHDLIINHFPTGRASTLPYPLYFLKRFGYQKVLNNAVSRASKIIVPLPFVKEDLIKTLKVSEEKIIVTQEGFDLSIEKGKVGDRVLQVSQTPYFLYIGNAYPHKNLEILIQGFEKLNSNNIKLLLVGKDDFFYKRLEKKKNENVIFLHNVTDSELFYLYSHAVAAVSASLMEGFGLLPLEALGAGTIPVVSDIPAFREVCANVALYFNSKDPSDIAAKLAQASKLIDKEREEILTRGKELLKKFSWEKMAEDTLEIYGEVV